MSRKPLPAGEGVAAMISQLSLSVGALVVRNWDEFVVVRNRFHSGFEANEKSTLRSPLHDSPISPKCISQFDAVSQSILKLHVE